jgi:hypothetical protein
MKTYIELINSFEDCNKFYWINALVKQGEIEPALAGYLIIYFKLI